MVRRPEGVDEPELPEQVHAFEGLAVAGEGEVDEVVGGQDPLVGEQAEDLVIPAGEVEPGGYPRNAAAAGLVAGPGPVHLASPPENPGESGFRSAPSPAS